MSNSNLIHSCSRTKKWKDHFISWGKQVATLVLSFLLFSQAFGQAFNLDQMANGKVTPPFPVPQPPASQLDWQNGNLNRNNAHFRESHSVPYRCDLTGLTAGTVYTLRIGIDVRVGSKFALDYFTGVQNLTPHGMFGHDAEKADPATDGVSFSPAPTINDYALPVPSGFINTPRTGYPAASFNALTTDNITGQPTQKQIRFYNAEVVTSAAADITYENAGSVDLSAATAEAVLRVTFRALASHALIAWGGHIAAEFDWPNMSAQFINGSPYHCRIKNLLNAAGNPIANGSTDRSLKTDAIFRPATCSLSADQTVCQGDQTVSSLSYSYTGDQTGITNYKWVLTNGTPSPGVKIQGDNAAGDSDPAVGTVSGSTFSSVTIIPGSGSVFNTAGSFTLALTLTNAGGNSDPCSANGTINAAATSNPGGPYSMCSSDASVQVVGTYGGGATGGAWSGGSGSFSNVSTNTTLKTVTATYTPTAAEKTNGSVQLTFTANDPDGTGPCSSVPQNVTLTINPAATVEAGGPNTVCQSGSPSAITLTGASVGGGAATGAWSITSLVPAAAGGATGTLSSTSQTGTPATVTYTPPADYSGTITLTLTTNNPTGPCDAVSDTRTINVTAKPAQPTAVVKLPSCTATTMTVEVTIPASVTSGTVTLKQSTGGASPMTQNVTDAVGGKLTFTGLTFGKGYSVTITANNCTSDKEECGDFSGGYQNTVTQQQSPATEQLVVLKDNRRPSVLAAPNPFSDRIRFTLKSEVSGRGTLELYNTLGQKVKTVFSGQVTAGQAQNIEYAVPGPQRAGLVYIFRVGEQQTTGKLIGLKQ